VGGGEKKDGKTRSSGFPRARGAHSSKGWEGTTLRFNTTAAGRYLSRQKRRTILKRGKRGKKMRIYIKKEGNLIVRATMKNKNHLFMLTGNKRSQMKGWAGCYDPTHDVLKGAPIPYKKRRRPTRRQTSLFQTYGRKRASLEGSAAPCQVAGKMISEMLNNSWLEGNESRRTEVKAC